MPKEFRRDARTVNAVKALRTLYRSCAMTRDIDAMMSALSANITFGDLKSIVAVLKTRRSALVTSMVKNGNKVISLALPRPTDDTGRRLSRRLNKLLGKKAELANDLYWIAASGEENVSELHKLRKVCRHIMYLLDFAKEDARINSVKSDLEDAREKLGSIRDDDVLLDLLRGTRGSVPLTKVIARVSNGRQVKYRKFFSAQIATAKEPKLLEGIHSLT